MANKLALEGVSVSIRGQRLIEDINLRLAEGEFVALVGPNGAGKTTLLRAALGLLPCSGRALINDRPVQQLSGRERAAQVAWLPQSVLVSEPLSALEVVAAARYRITESRADAEAAARKSLQSAGVAEFANRAVNSLSGGEHQRVAVACLIAQEAPLLLLDEPANHLDPAQQIGLFKLLGRVWRDGRGLLCITHDVNMLRHLGAAEIRVVGMSGGRIRFEADYGSPELPGHLEALFGTPFVSVDLPGGRALVAISASA